MTFIFPLNKESQTYHFSVMKTVSILNTLGDTSSFSLLSHNPYGLQALEIALMLLRAGILSALGLLPPMVPSLPTAPPHQPSPTLSPNHSTTEPSQVSRHQIQARKRPLLVMSSDAILPCTLQFANMYLLV